MDKIKLANDILEKGEPLNWSKDHKGYAGYKPQAVIDAVNDAEIEWDLEVISISTRDSGKENKNKHKIVDALVHVRLTINGHKKDAVASHPILDDYGDAVKSAQSDAMKKAFAHFSVGKRAYQGLLNGKSKKVEEDEDEPF